MYYDDRLATVLRPKVNGAGPARIQYLQLLDLLGRTPADAAGRQDDAAHRRLAELSQVLPVADQVALLAEPALRLQSSKLVASLAQTGPQVAVAAVRAAHLSDDQWLDLIPILPHSARVAMWARLELGEKARDRLGRLGIGQMALPAAEKQVVLRHASASVPEGGIGAIVRRIEAFRKAREETGSFEDNDVSRLEPDVRSFDFVTDATGRISWCEARVAAMITGIDLDEFPQLHDALHHHQPIRVAAVTLDGAPAIAGEWQVDASPSFAPQGGYFLGHIGRFRRRAEMVSPSPGATATNPEAERLRQVLHELRNPVNAIQGFAEIIQQQLFGPAPHEYRALAVVIIADCARMLGGFEELERLAQLAGHTIRLAAGDSDLAACIAATVEQLKPHTDGRGSSFVTSASGDHFSLGLAPVETERLCWRLLATLASCAGADESLRITLQRLDQFMQASLELPVMLAHLDNDALVNVASEMEGNTLSASMFGTGFALRLAANEASGAGGRLERRHNTLHLLLPIAAGWSNPC